MKPEKIISGGQTGADKTALIAARDLGIATGGSAPKGYRIQLPDGSDSIDPELADYGLVEHESADWPPRTIQNVLNSDATLWVGFAGSGGGRLTLNTAQKNRKPFIVNPTPELLRDWVEQLQIKVLNVAGNRASSLNPTIERDTYRLLIEAFGEVDRA